MNVEGGIENKGEININCRRIEIQRNRRMQVYKRENKMKGRI